MIGSNFNLAIILANLIAALIGMSIHEFAHAYVAYRMGDSTARDMGRMTLDPRANIDPLGFLMWVVVGFGVLGSVPMNPSRMRNKRWGYFWAVAAGPLSNLAIAGVLAILFRLGVWRFAGAGPNDLIPSLDLVMTRIFMLNLVLFLFNLIPLFPLDGWRMLLMALPPNDGYRLSAYERESYILLIILIFIGFVSPQLNILAAIIQPIGNFFMRLLLLTGL
jgi:Zn-dependent protease